MMYLTFLLFFIGAVMFYLIPTGVAFYRKHEQLVPIFIVNLFLGWSLVGWVICLAWSFQSALSGGRSSRDVNVTVNLNQDVDMPRGTVVDSRPAASFPPPHDA